MSVIKQKTADEMRISDWSSDVCSSDLRALKLDRRPPRVGSLVAQIRDYESVKTFFTSTTLFAIADLPFIVLFIAIVGMIGGPVALVLVFFVPISLAVGFSVYRPTAELQARENDEADRKSTRLNSSH